MMLIPLRTPETNRVDLLIILEQDNLERIKRHDNAEVMWGQLGFDPGCRPGTISIAYATAEEVAKVKDLAAKGKPRDILCMLTGGFEYRPDLGDHDRGPESLTKCELRQGHAGPHKCGDITWEGPDQP
jgi:hypothetical protein